MFSSMNSTAASGCCRKRAYMAITIPGVQNPHWLPCSSAMRRCRGCTPVRREPIPSTVVTAQPSIEARGARQALTAMCRGLPSAASHTETITVQAPQPPWNGQGAVGVG